MRPTTARTLLLALSLITIAAPSANAAWNPDPATGATVVAIGASDQQIRGAIPDGAGGVILLYTDYFAIAGYKLFAARVNASGSFLWNVALSPGQQNATPYAVYASDGAGGAVIEYFENRGGGNLVYGQHVNSVGGGTFGTGVPLTIGVVANQTFGGVISDGAGGLIATFSDNRAGNYDVYAQRLNASGSPLWAAGGLVVCNAANDQFAQALCTDNANGAIVSFFDQRAGGPDQYAARITNAGTLPWTANGVAVSSSHKFSSAYSSEVRGIAPDGNGGAIFVWADGRLSGNFNADLFAERLNANGNALWGGGGHAITSLNTSFVDIHLVPDLKGGALLAWTDARTGSQLPYAQRLDAAGAPRWTPSGVLATTFTRSMSYLDATSDGFGGLILSWNDVATGSVTAVAQRFNIDGVEQWPATGAIITEGSMTVDQPRLAADGAGGVLVGFQANRTGQGSGCDIYAQRIERFGKRGDPSPVIARIKDVSADQGGHLALEWTASYLDVQSDPTVADYTLWRRVPAASLVATLAARGARVDQPLAREAAAPQLRTTIQNAQTLYWEYVSTVNARTLPGYSSTMLTTTDSLPGSNPKTSFMVAAENASGSQWWFSAPDSGYSVDNIPPTTPGPFLAAFVAGATHLHWSRNTEPDLANYRVYRGTSAGFPADPAHLIATPSDSGYIDPVGTPSYYKLSAVDAHGNESALASLSPAATLDVAGPVLEFALAAPAPNPVRGSAILRYSLPAAARVTLVLFDAQGRVVRTLADGTFAAGEHSARLDARDAGGAALKPGLYFARLTSAMGTRVRRVVILE